MPSEKRDRVPGKKGHHRSSDSGIARDFAEQPNGVSALQRALESALAEADGWKAKFKQADAELVKTHKRLKEVESQWKAVFERGEILEADKTRFHREKKNLQSEVETLKQEILRLRRSPSREAPPPKPMEIPKQSPLHSPVHPPVAAAPKLTRRESKKNKDDHEKARLSQRFEIKDDNSVSSGESARRRRESYVEPFGPGGRPQSVIQTQHAPARPTRSFSNYSASHTNAPLFSHINQTQYSSVPRTSYTPYDDEAVVDDHDYDDGNYYPHPLPEPPRTRR